MATTVDRMAMWTFAVVAMVTGLGLHPAAEAEPRTATLGDLGRRVGLSAPAISPDGQSAALLVSRVNYANDRYEQSLVLVDVATGAVRELAAANTNAASPRWSPSGDRLAWLATPGAGPAQLYVFEIGKAAARPVKLTSVPRGVRNNMVGIVPFAWSPDGASIAFVTADPKKVAPGEERFNRSFEVRDNDYLTSEAPPTFHAWVVPAAGGKARRLHSGAESVAGVAWLKDGRSLVLSSQPYPHNSELDYAEFMRASSNTTALKRIDVGSGVEQLLLPMARILSAPVTAPGGDLIAYLHSRGPDPWMHTSNVAVVSPSGGEPRDITMPLDRNIAQFTWLPDGKSIVVMAANGTRFSLWLQPLDGAGRQLDLGPVIELDGLSASKAGALAFVGTEAMHPPELYVMASSQAKPRRITHFNDYLAGLRFGGTETVRWQLDGFDQAGVLVYPPDYQPDQRHPLVVHIHGGPQATSTEALDLFDEILAAQGWLVFRPNYRGSDSQGDVYQTAVIKDPGDGPGRDILAGIAAVKARANVDPTRIAVSGWSYGGYLSGWLITHFQGWSAAVLGAPMTDAVDWYDLSCCNAWADPVFGGSPWVNDNLDNYRRYSPVNSAAKAAAPVLLLHNLSDPEAPFTQSYHFYHALRDNGVEVKFVAYPLQGHGPETDPVNERDKYRRWIDWFAQHFNAAGPVPAAH